MATSLMSGGDPALLSQCLEFCQALASMGQTITFSVTLGSTFAFNLDTSVKATSSDMKITKKKKPSPSTLRRNIQRKREFLKQKSEISNDMEATSLPEPTFQCEHCENSFKTENGLKIHIGKSHKDLKSSLTPEKVRDTTKEPSLTVSPVRDTGREEIQTEEGEETPPPVEVEIVQRTFSVESLCNFDRLNYHLEADLNKDIVKNFQVHEKEKLSKKWTRFEILITGVKGSRVIWPKSQEVCNNIKLTK